MYLYHFPSNAKAIANISWADADWCTGVRARLVHGTARLRTGELQETTTPRA